MDAPIPGTTKLHRLEENTGPAAVSVVSSSDYLKHIESAAAKVPVQGARCRPDRQKLLGN
ncbi:hypothetical protein [Variovorax guangxiensis]|uniref:hypothetical protein n=1 Tax=Variovorax guangxiensis TaxID=1775474 RepID=UPI002859EA3A|nr:hypothetical protein [Variovorax guangxiensis]MDR6860206.1 aryl-alcohol dehydrogenase-like predicted oxidoreductase [Variovorax guangxiensis]